MPLPGGPCWLHVGDLPGVTAVSGHSPTGVQATVYVTGSTGEPQHNQHLMATLNSALTTAF